MDRITLKEELDRLGIDEREYSLYNDLVLDSIVLYQNYDRWEVFYYDERAQRTDEKTFSSEADACDHIYQLFIDLQRVKNKVGMI